MIDQMCLLHPLVAQLIFESGRFNSLEAARPAPRASSCPVVRAGSLGRTQHPAKDERALRRVIAEALKLLAGTSDGLHLGPLGPLPAYISQPEVVPSISAMAFSTCGATRVTESSRVEKQRRSVPSAGPPHQEST